MTAPANVDIEMFRGDSDDLLITITDDATPANLIDLSEAVDGTADRPAIVRFAVKKDPSKEKNEKGAILKLSYALSEIEVLPQAIPSTQGQCIIKIDKPDTSDNKAGDYFWDVEVTRQDIERIGSSVGTIALVNGSKVVAGTSTAITKAKEGDVIQMMSGANIGRVSLITKIVSDVSFEVERAEWISDPSVIFEIRRGKSKTVVYGAFKLIQDVVQ